MSRKSFVVATLLLSCFSIVVSAQEKKPTVTKRIAIRAGHLIDGKNDKPLENALIVIEGDKIVSVVAGGAAAAGGEMGHPPKTTVPPGITCLHTPVLLHRRNTPEGEHQQ